jgi:hypothetical protein
MKTQVIVPQISDYYKELVSDLNKYSEIIYSLPDKAIEDFFFEIPSIILCFSEPVKGGDDKWNDLSRVFENLRLNVTYRQTLIRLAFMEQEEKSDNNLRLPLTPKELLEYLLRLDIYWG